MSPYLVDERHKQRIAHEAGNVLRLRDRLPARNGECAGTFKRFWCCLQTRYNLHQFLCCVSIQARFMSTMPLP